MDMEEDGLMSSQSKDLNPSQLQWNGLLSLPASSATTQKRISGRKKFRETRHPVFRGVRQRNNGKWGCEVRKPQTKSRIWLGTFQTPEMAARAHDVAALALRGNSALLNFTDSLRLLPLPKSTSPEDIQMTAVAAAEAFGPGNSSQQMRNTETVPKPSTVFLDDEEVFNMPSLLASMAEGMLITPPDTQKGCDWDDMDCPDDFHLWAD